MPQHESKNSKYIFTSIPIPISISINISITVLTSLSPPSSDSDLIPSVLLDMIYCEFLH